MTQKRKSRQLWKSGLYRSLFFSYVIVLLVPILVSPLVLYGAGDAITRQVDHANETSLTLLRDAVDAQLSEIYTASSYLLIHEAAWRLKQKEHFTSDDTADLRLLQSMLKQFIGQSPIIADIYLCFPLADAVLSKKDLTYGQGFAYTAQTELGMDYARWKEELGFSGRRKHLIVGDHENKARQHLLIYHQYNRITNEGVSPLVIVTNVNLDMLRGLLRDYGQGGAASFSIENGDAAISDGSASAEPKKATLLDRLFYHGLSARMAGSKVLDWTYRLTPEADATALGSEMPAALAAYYVVCLLLGLLLVGIFSRNHYTPVQRLTGTLLSSMRRTQPNDGIDQNEYAFLELELTRMLQELRDSDRQIGEMQNLRKEKLLHDMARGRVDSHTDKRLEEFGLSVRRCSFMLVVYSVDQIDLHLSSLPDEDTEDDRTSLDLIDLVISRVAGSFQPTGCTTHLFSIDNMIACLLLAEETRLESEQVTELANRALRYLYDRLGITATAAVSGVHEELTEMPEAYQEARETLGSMALKGQERQTSCYEKLPNSYGAGDLDGLTRQTAFQQQLVMLKKAQEYEQMEQCFLKEVDRAFAGAAALSRRQLELLLTRYVGVLWEIAAEMPENTRDVQLEENLLGCGDIITLKCCAQKLFQKMKQEDNPKEGGEPISERDRQIVAYIQEHYTDCNLNINALSDHFHLTPSYLSKIVRRCVGTTALDYIQSLRIAKARKLISGTDKSLQEIAEEVGYGNKLNIIRAFKRSEGVTPSVYREQNAR